MSNFPWQSLSKHHQILKQHHLRDFLKDETRNQALLVRFQDLLFDLSHEKITLETIRKQFPHLVERAKLREKIKGLFNGNHINFTENRAVLHTALRAPLNSDLHDPAHNPKIAEVLQNVHKVLDSIKVFSQKVRTGELRGATGKQLVNLVVIGIGGSYLSIEFVYESLRSHPTYKTLAEGRKIRFLANVDPIDFSRAIEGLNVEQTLILVNSKTFTTAETTLNAKSCKQWLLVEYAKLGVTDAVLIADLHISACSTNIAETSKFGINQQNVFGFWDFVGGRFSVWSAIGVVPLAVHFGFQVVEEFLKGGHSIDRLLLHEDLEKNVPLLLGLVGFYRSAVEGYTSRAIIPYCQALNKLAPHIQQLDMESNGKRVDSNGNILSYPTTVINFGEPGTNGQHSFFQLLHQGRAVPVQFIGFTKSQQPYLVEHDPVSNHDELMSNFFSQPDALAIGKTRKQLEEEKTPQNLIPHKEFPGDRPSLSLLFLGQLDAYKCGQLLALYEHRTSVQGFLWDINSYDQYGVELGKVLAKTVRGILQVGGGEALEKSNINSATRRLISEYLSHK